MTAPLSTYRLQLRPEFGFDAAAAVVDHLAALGVSHVYCSPYLQAAPGSAHGYDVVDHHRVNEELGGPEAHARFLAAVRDAGLGQVLDIVPNHMAITPENAWWTDVLENGPSSVYASYFDVDWDPPESKLRNTVLLPVLGDHYGRVLEAGDITLARNLGIFEVHYFDHVVPVSPRSYDLPLSMAAAASGSDELAFLARVAAALPHATAVDAASVRARHRDKAVLKRQLARLCEEDPDAAKALDGAMAEINADVDLLDVLLDRQNWRLAFWRTAGEELDYRRFFDITTLAGLRMEDPEVFADTHDLILRWVADGSLDGLRIDHPDGLRDPEGYLRRLAEAAPGAWVVVEKILEPGEALPTSWPVAGTTGYDFLNRLQSLYVDPAGEAPLTEAYGAFTGEPTDFHEVADTGKRLVMRDVLAADLRRLTKLFSQLIEVERRHRDFTSNELHDVLVEVIAAFDAYRTYTRPGTCTPEDAARVDHALAAAAEARPDMDAELLGFLGRVLQGDVAGPTATELLMRFQQTTGPIMAKGIEDTAFYRYNRLVALNEVGGDPGHFAGDVDGFLAQLAEAQRDWPTAMLASSTHDTKRSEDVRARIAVLSEVPGDFAAAVDRWSARNERHRTGDLPDRNLEWLLYQTLVGAHPLPVERALAYVEKATKEAKQHTSWVDPVPAYDEAVRRFVEGVLGDDAFVADLDAFAAPLVDPGRVNALSAQLVKLTAPGVPDVYQGTELWDDSLVDPDNRRPVDYDVRRRLLAELDGLSAAEVWARRAEGLPKLLVTRAALHLRRRLPGVFRGGIEQLAADDHLVAFVRDGRVATLAPRLPVGLARRGGWGDATVALPDGRWRDELTGDVTDGGRVSVAGLLGNLPVALLVREV